MAHTNSTENYGLPQWIGTDKPTFLGDFNSAFATIDTTMKANSDTATAASATANAADAVASSAATNATNAISIANNAASEAATATSAAASATQIANTAKTTADNALHASAANNIENLAPAYDNTLTYNVGDLVTYIDAQNSGKLYKCIVAVNTPMDFNINYWDDVTTSEIYKVKNRTLASVTSDGVKTYSELLTELKNLLYAIPLTECELVKSYDDAVVIFNFDSLDTSTTYKALKWSNVDIFGDGTLSITVLATRPDSVQYQEVQITSTGVVSSYDRSSTVPNAGISLTVRTI